jgi:hypothetical protein
MPRIKKINLEVDQKTTNKDVGITKTLPISKTPPKNDNFLPIKDLHSPITQSAENSVFNKNALIQLHIAEYQALTTRVTYWLITQTSLLPIVVIYLALATQIWASNIIIREITLWVTVVGLYIIGSVWGNTMLEHYTAVDYTERYLRRMIQKEIDPKSIFWGYEPHLINNRPTPSSVEMFIVVLSGVVFIIAFLYRYFSGFTLYDIFGSVFSLILLINLAYVSLKAGKIRKTWSRSLINIAPKLEELEKGK